MSKLNFFRILLLIMGVTSTAAMISSSITIKKYRDIETRLMQTLETQNGALQKQSDTIKFQDEVIRSQSRTIERLKEALAERSKSKGPVVLNGRLDSE